MVTLGVYLVGDRADGVLVRALVLLPLPASSPAPGIGGEYAAINSAIDELIPARVRGRVDLIINGSYWVGAAAGAAAALIFCSNTSIFPADVGWRLAFGLGAVLGLADPARPPQRAGEPALAVHPRPRGGGRADRRRDRAARSRRRPARSCPEPDGASRVRQREASRSARSPGSRSSLYPRRAILGLALFVGQAFLYNAVMFNLGTLLTTSSASASGACPFLHPRSPPATSSGPLLLGRLFDTVGRKPMIAVSYLGSAAISVRARCRSSWPGALTPGRSSPCWCVVFFLASAGASAAYLTVSEIFPMETRALAIAFFYAVGTAVGGITGPLLFGQLIDSGDRAGGDRRSPSARR